MDRIGLLHIQQRKSPRVDMLRRFDLFSRCSERELRFLATQVDEVWSPAGEVLIVEGRPPDTFYMLLEGIVSAAAAGEPGVRYGTGAAFDMVAMAERRPARATVTAESPVRMLVMSRAQFQAVTGLPRLQASLGQVTSRAGVAPPLEPRIAARPQTQSEMT